MKSIALLASYFLVSDLSAQIVINEIHYDPADVTKAEEFIELHNPTASAVNIGGWHIEDGVDYVIPAGTTISAGGYRVVAQNVAAFQAKFGSTPLGPWMGKLSNSGERIQLKNTAAALVDEVTYGSGFPWPTGSRGTGSSMSLIHPSLDNDIAGSWRAGTPTPGSQNSVYSTTAPPQIRQVAHTPEQPAANVPVVITAKITDPQGVASATLSYQLVNPGSYIRKTDAAYATTWTNIAMKDDGTSGDAIAGDGVYSATMPAALQTHRRLVRYRISATDGTSAITVPYADDEQPNFAYFVYTATPNYSGAVEPGGTPARAAVKTIPASVLNTLQTWQLITDATDHDNMLYVSTYNSVRFYGTFVYEGKVYDHIQYHNRGIGSTYVSGKNKFVLFFNRARDIRVRDNWGNYFSAEWNSIPVDACAGPWVGVHRGMAGVEEAASYRMYELAGITSLRTTYLQLRVVRGANEAGTGQYDSDFWGLYMALEPTEGNLLDERNLPDGNVYSIEGSNGDKKHQGPTQPTDTSDWTSFRDASIAAGQTEQWYRSNMDLNAFYTFFALNRFCGNVDVRPGDNHRYYHRPTDNRWVVFPYDLDMMVLPTHHWGGTLADGVVWAGSTKQSVLLSRHANLAIEFRNRARELLDLMGSDASASGGQIGQLIDEYAQMVNPTGAPLTWADADEIMWCNNPRTKGSGAASGQGSHKNNFYRATYSDSRGGLGGTPATSWTRTHPDPDGDGYATFEDKMDYLVKFMTNAWPGGKWFRSNGQQNGYGYKYLEWESIYGGWGDCKSDPATADLAFPDTPTISYTGPVNYPANALDFTSSAFSKATSGGTKFSAMQWRIGEIYAPGISGYVAGEKRIYEVENVWTSDELPAFAATARVPLIYAKPGHTYRARVRHKDANGRWSHWSSPVQFIPSTPNISVYKESLIVSEVNYNPAPVTPAEYAAGYSSDDFEWLEIKNVSTQPVDCTGIRFTKGINFDFPDNYTIPAGGFALIVKNQAAFQLRWGNAFNGIIAGTYPSNKLSNGSENLKLSYGAGTPVIEFTYTDNTPWPPESDGTGRTLSLRNPGMLPDPTAGKNWKASSAIGGSPGADDVFNFASWSTAYPGLSNPLGDSDHDGIPELLEMGLSGNPMKPSPEVLPVTGIGSFSVGGVPGKYLTLQFTHRTDGPNLQFSVQFATSPTGPWTSNGVLIGLSSVTQDSVTETWRSSRSLNEEPAQFGRVKLSMP